MTTLLSQLRDSVKMLASPADAQCDFLRKFGTYPSADELALIFDGWAKAAGQLVRDGLISAEVLEEIRQLDRRLDEFSGDAYAPEWHVSALATSRHWADVRILAKRVLDLMEK